MKTGAFKWWHGVVAVAAVAAVAYGAWSVTGRRAGLPSQPDSITMVDVNTGDLFVFDVSGRKAVMVPETNPQTGQSSLLRVKKADDGAWVIYERDLAALARIPGNKKAIVDASTGEVHVASEQRKRGR